MANSYQKYEFCLYLSTTVFRQQLPPSALSTYWCMQRTDANEAIRNIL